MSGKPRINLSGQEFGRLVVLSLAAPFVRASGLPDRAWRCRCACGTEVAIRQRGLTHGKTQSCGCLAHERRRAANTQHGMTNTRAYVAWENMKARCSKSQHPEWKNYGARGISVCARWQQFIPFLQDMGEPVPGMSLDRINNDGNYEPGNCRWADAKTQANNQRRRCNKANLGRSSSDASAHSLT